MVGRRFLAHAQGKVKDRAGNSQVQRGRGRVEGKEEFSFAQKETVKRLFMEVSMILGNSDGEVIVQRSYKLGRVHSFTEELSTPSLHLLLYGINSSSALWGQISAR